MTCLPNAAYFVCFSFEFCLQCVLLSSTLYRFREFTSWIELNWIVHMQFLLWFLPGGTIKIHRNRTSTNEVNVVAIEYQQTSKSMPFIFRFNYLYGLFFIDLKSNSHTNIYLFAYFLGLSISTFLITDSISKVYKW